ncbi:unnamed protein product, partial [Cladocopium goreaui]
MEFDWITSSAAATPGRDQNTSRLEEGAAGMGKRQAAARVTVKVRTPPAAVQAVEVVQETRTEFPAQVPSSRFSMVSQAWMECLVRPDQEANTVDQFVQIRRRTPWIPCWWSRGRGPRTLPRPGSRGRGPWLNPTGTHLRIVGCAQQWN